MRVTGRLRTLAVMPVLAGVLFASVGATASARTHAAASLTPAEPASHGRCGHVSVGYTTAKVTTEHVRCRRARRMVKRWVRNSDEYCDNYGYCDPAYIKGFRCVKGTGASQYTVALRCRNDGRRVKATWGD